MIKHGINLNFYAKIREQHVLRKKTKKRSEVLCEHAF